MLMSRPLLLLGLLLQASFLSYTSLAQEVEEGAQTQQELYLAECVSLDETGAPSEGIFCSNDTVAVLDQSITPPIVTEFNATGRTSPGVATAFSLQAAVYNNPAACNGTMCDLQDLQEPAVQGAYFTILGAQLSGENARIAVRNIPVQPPEVDTPDPCSFPLDNTGGVGVTSSEAEIHLLWHNNGPVVSGEDAAAQLTGFGACPTSYVEEVDQSLGGALTAGGCNGSSNGTATCNLQAIFFFP
ncbi:unnamed protein product, partial [Chrysoparadoxa australica]